MAPLTVKKDDRHPPYPRLRMAARVLTVFTLVLQTAYVVFSAAVAREVSWTLMFVGFDVALVVYCRFYFPWIEGVAETSRQARHGWLLMDDLVRFVVKLAMWDLFLLSPVIALTALRVYLFGWESLVPW